MTIREAQPEDSPGIARVHVDTWRASYRGQIDDDYLDNLSYDQAEQSGPAAIARGEGHGDFMFVAVDDGNVVGFAVGGVERTGDEHSGELHALYVHPSCHGRGVGRCLVEAVARRLMDQGHKSMLVWTLIANPARGFYERLGGSYLRTDIIHIGGVAYDKVAYGWSDITTLVPSQSSSGS
jgi:ribosomal protein S18 acetylase RimI-like enzyme